MADWEVLSLFIHNKTLENTFKAEKKQKIVIWNEENTSCDCLEINISKQTSDNMYLQQEQNPFYSYVCLT